MPDTDTPASHKPAVNLAPMLITKPGDDDAVAKADDSHSDNHAAQNVTAQPAAAANSSIDAPEPVGVWELSSAEARHELVRYFKEADKAWRKIFAIHHPSSLPNCDMLSQWAKSEFPEGLGSRRCLDELVRRFRILGAESGSCLLLSHAVQWSNVHVPRRDSNSFDVTYKPYDFSRSAPAAQKVRQAVSNFFTTVEALGVTTFNEEERMPLDEVKALKLCFRAMGYSRAQYRKEVAEHGTAWQAFVDFAGEWEKAYEDIADEHSKTIERIDSPSRKKRRVDTSGDAVAEVD